MALGLDASLDAPLGEDLIGIPTVSIPEVDFYYYRPDGTSLYLRPNGANLYIRPAA